MEHKFQINLRGIIDLLSEHLYSGPEVFVRELLQNGVDAITARRQQDSDHRGEVTFECHRPKGKPPALVVTDNGLGLTPDDVHKFLATIGLSSKRALGGQPHADFLGQFGIGILSCFVVSDEIVVLTRSAQDAESPAVEWRAKADGTYSLRELNSDLKVGTQVWLTAKPGMEHLFERTEVKRLAQQYGEILPYPIRLVAGETQETINEQGAPWRHRFASPQAWRRRLLEFGNSTFGTSFIDVVPLVSTTGGVDGVAFVLPFTPPPAARKQHRVYLKNMFLSNAASNLLPDWAFFVRAVVNVNELRPTASRESFYEDDKLARTRNELAGSLRTYLLALAEDNPERLEQIIQIHHRAIKALAVDDDEFFAIIMDYLPFESSIGTVSFGEYRQGSSHIRYTTDVDTFRQISSVAAAQGLNVVNAGYTYDAELLAKAAEADPRLTVEIVDSSSLTQEFDALTADEEGQIDPLLQIADEILRPFRCRADAKKFRPEQVPALFITTRGGRFFRSLEQSQQISGSLWSGVLDRLRHDGPLIESSAQLCLNFNNPMIQQLAATPDRTLLTQVVEMLYVQSLLLGHHPLNSREMAILNQGMMTLIQRSLEQSRGG